MGVVSRPRCRHSRSRPKENEGSGRWPREERPAAKGNPAEQHPNHHQANSEVDNEGMVEADIWHRVLSLWFREVSRPQRSPRPGAQQHAGGLGLRGDHDLPDHLLVIDATEHVAGERKPPHLLWQNANAGHVSRLDVRADAEVWEPEPMLSILRGQLQNDGFALLQENLVRAVLRHLGGHLDHAFVLRDR